MLTDTHCHLFNEYFDDIDKVINDAKDNKVTRYINNATNLDNCREVIITSKNNRDIFYSLGIHPDSVEDDLEELRKLVIDNLNDEKFIAIGEIGLDYHYGKENKDRQIKVFDYQLALAEEFNLPVIIHSRDATQDTLDCIKKYNVKGSLHCFNGSLEIAKEYIKLGFYFGVNGVITFKNAKIDEVIKELPINRILLETDTPYLTPEPFRKCSNEPKYILTIAEYIANLFDISLEEVMRITEENVTNLFDI